MKDLKLKSSVKGEKSFPENCEKILQSLRDGEERFPKPNEAINKVKQLNRDREMLFRLKKQAESAALAQKENRQAETDCRRVASLCDTLIRKIESLLRSAKDTERRIRKDKVKRACESYGSYLGDFRQMVLESPAFYEQAWEEPGNRDPKSAVKEKCRRIAASLNVICHAGGTNAPALLDRYLKNFNDDDLANYRARLETISMCRPPVASESEDRIVGYKVFRCEGNTEQFARLYAYMALQGMRCTQEEDGMPGKMNELLLPDFESFVCFDLESSGTMGTNHGDLPAEIIEIGAVRVKNGEITDRFSTLVNPGRRIVPHVAKLTGITDEMVRGKPSVGQAVRAFADFCKDDILVGHNIRSCDIPMIVAAGKREGIAFDNAFFDTYLFAEANKEGREWPGLGLEALAHYFGIEMSDAHRAWCDAEANALLYLAMKKMEGVILPCHLPKIERQKEEVPKDGEEQKKHHRIRRRRRRRSSSHDKQDAESATARSESPATAEE